MTVDGHGLIRSSQIVFACNQQDIKMVSCDLT